jgi:ribosome biogenesis protein ENP2
MHGYFVSLKLYDAARVIANPFVYAEHREKIVKEKMEKLAETRIRTKKDGGVKVNKALAEKIQKEDEREMKRDSVRRAKKAERDGEAMDVDEEMQEDGTKKPSLLNDPRFKKLFEDPDFAIDEDSREYALMNPSAVAQRRGMKDGASTRGRTAVEEEDESDRASSDSHAHSESESGSGSDSSDAGGKHSFPLPITHV